MGGPKNGERKQPLTVPFRESNGVSTHFWDACLYLVTLSKMVEVA